MASAALTAALVTGNGRSLSPTVYEWQISEKAAAAYRRALTTGAVSAGWPEGRGRGGSGRETVDAAAADGGRGRGDRGRNGKVCDGNYCIKN